jgi:hypothetical protein
MKAHNARNLVSEIQDIIDTSIELALADYTLDKVALKERLERQQNSLSLSLQDVTEETRGVQPDQPWPRA